MLCQNTKKIILFGVIFTATRGAVGAISVAYMAYYGLSTIDIGMIKGWQALIVFLLDIPLAYFADKKSKKLSVLLSALFCFLWMLSMGLAQNKIHFYIAEFFNSIFMALSSGAFIAYLINSEKDKNNIKYVLSKYGQWQFLVLGISGFAGAALITVDNRDIWFLCAIVIVLQIFAFSFYLPKDVSLNGDKKIRSFLGEVGAVFKTRRDSLMKALLLNIMILSIFYQSLIQFWQPFFISDLSVDKGIVFSLVFLFILLSQSFAGFICSKYKDGYKVVIISMAVFLPLYVVINLSPIQAVYAFSINICLFMFVNRVIFFNVSSLFHQSIDDSYRATADAVISTMTRILLFIALPTMGYFLKAYDYSFVLGIVFIFSVTVYIFSEFKVFKGIEQKS